MAQITAEQKKLGKLSDVVITRTSKIGTIILSDDLNYDTAIEWLVKKKEDLERPVTINEVIPGFPLDVANALQLAVQELFGFKELKSVPGFFGSTPPSFMNVPINHKGDTVEVFTGRFAVPAFDQNGPRGKGTVGYLQTAPVGSEALAIGGCVKNKDLPKVKELTQLTRKFVRERSLYRGKAIKVFSFKTVRNPFTGDETEEAPNPVFMDVTECPTVILNRGTEMMLDATVIAPIQYSETFRRQGIPLKRAAALIGHFGNGKTLFASKAAHYAVQHGWTFMYVDKISDLPRYFLMAQRYAPCVVFVEDLDCLPEAQINELLNTLDGIDTKGKEVMLIATTNFVERLPVGVTRPGRLDAVVPFEKPDAECAGRFVKFYLSGLYDPSLVDADKCGEALAGMGGSVIAEVVRRSKAYAIRRAHGDDSDLKIRTEDIIGAAVGMKAHIALIERESPKPKTPMEQFGDAVGNRLGGALMYASELIKRGDYSPAEAAEVVVNDGE